MDAVTYYKPKHFQVHEFVDKETHRRFNERSWMFLDPRILYTADGIREYFGKPVTINDWLWGGAAQWRGLRLIHSPVYKPYSQHSYGRALDMTIRGVSAEEARKAIMAHADDERFQYITRMEDGVSWLHADTANVPNRIHLFNP